MSKKAESLRKGTHTGRLQERALPVAVSITSRLNKLDALESIDAAPERREPTPERVVERVIDRVVEVEKPVPDRLPLNDIKPRVTNLRPVYEAHARDLACNIALVGLIQPLAVDLRGHLLAGDHRRRALELLQELSEWPDRALKLLPNLEDSDEDTLGKVLTAWRRLKFDDGVPVHRIPIDAAADPAAAKAIELSENTQRSNFTKDEVQNAYKELVAAGYRHTVGRPKKGEKAIGPQLELLYGKASRTIEKYVAELRATSSATNTATDAPTPQDAALKAVMPQATLRITKKGAGAITIPFSSLDEFHALLGRLRPAP
jgi:hypothetical protein